MMDKMMTLDIAQAMQGQWRGRPSPPPVFVEQRILELEKIGLTDVEDMPGVPSMTRQYAIASFWRKNLPYFITFDDELLGRREILEDRYGLAILSISEAMMLLRDINGPVD